MENQDDKTNDFNLDEFLTKAERERRLKRDGFVVDPKKGEIIAAIGEKGTITLYHNKQSGETGIELAYRF